MTTEKRSIPRERAKRLVFLRENGLRLTREELSKRSGIPTSTIQNWEQARNFGISEKGAKRLLEALRKEGLNCSIEWLLYGVGNKPSSPLLETENQASSLKSIEDDIIAKELELFHELNSDAIHATITDDTMSPYFWPGDYVAGVQLYTNNIKKAIGLPCIIQTTSGITTVRLLEEGSMQDSFNLICLNQHALTKSINQNVQLISAAPIIWWRRKKFKT